MGVGVMGVGVTGVGVVVYRCYGEGVVIVGVLSGHGIV